MCKLAGRAGVRRTCSLKQLRPQTTRRRSERPRSGESRPSRKPRVRTGLGLYDRPETGAPGGCPGNCGLWSLELVLARGRGTGRGCTAPSPWPDQLCSRLGALSTCLRRLGKGSRKGWGGEVSWAQSVGEEEGLPMLRCPPPLCWF